MVSNQVCREGSGMKGHDDLPIKGLSAWLPGSSDLFGLDREPHIDLPGGFVMRPETYISDSERRTWKERLFERPWKPFTRTKPASIAWIVGKEVLVSWNTFLKFKGEK